MPDNQDIEHFEDRADFLTEVVIRSFYLILMVIARRNYRVYPDDQDQNVP